MTEKKQKEFKKHWEGIFTKDMSGKPLDGYKKIVKITTVDQSDFKEKMEGKYGEEELYEFNILTDKGKEKAKLIVNENKRALGRILIGNKEYTIWKFVNEDGVSMSFKYENKYWVNVEKKKDKNNETYFKIKFVYKEYEEEPDPLDSEEEIPF